MPIIDLAEIARAARGGEPDRVALRRYQQATVVRSHRAQLVACYDGAGLTRGGMIAIDYDLDPTGQVTDARVVDNDLGEQLATCVVDGSRRWRFPAGDAPTTIRFPYTFDPEGAGEGDALDLRDLEGLDVLDRLDVFGGDVPGRIDLRGIPSPPEPQEPPEPPAPPPAPTPATPPLPPSPP